MILRVKMSNSQPESNFISCNYKLFLYLMKEYRNDLGFDGETLVDLGNKRNLGLIKTIKHMIFELLTYVDQLFTLTI